MDTLKAGAALTANQSLKSDNGKYRLTMQPDGNLVLYGNGSQAVWDTGTWRVSSTHRPERAVLQADGNLMLFSRAGAPIWTTGKKSGSGFRLTLQDDRNLVMYRSDNSAAWSTNTVHTPPREISFSKSREVVGHDRTMTTEGKLYRNGLMTCSVYTKNNNWFGGLRGKLFVVVKDDHGRAIWVSKEFKCTTRCSVPDMSCASYGQDLFSEQFPEQVGLHAGAVDVYQADTASFLDLRKQVIRVAKETLETIGELKDLAGKLF